MSYDFHNAKRIPKIVSKAYFHLFKKFVCYLKLSYFAQVAQQINTLLLQKRSEKKEKTIDSISEENFLRIPSTFQDDKNEYKKKLLTNSSKGCYVNL